MGRPSIYSQELADEIIRRYTDGELIKDILAADERMPHLSNFYRWEADRPDFREAIALARSKRADVYFEEALQIADDKSGDEKETKYGTVCDTEFVQRSRLRVETRLKAAAILNRDRYGDKQKVEVSGGITLRFAEMDDAELVAEVKRLGESVTKILATGFLEQVKAITAAPETGDE